MSTPDIEILARLYAQTILLALVFTGAGHRLYRFAFGADPTEPASLRWATGFFLGLSIFLPIFLVGSRWIGAGPALWAAVLPMAAVGLMEARGAAPSAKPAIATAGALLLLIAAYSITNAALWISWRLPPGGEPSLFTHFGSIHSGRYANYAIYIAEHGVVPRLGQNGGQSMLASIHLLLGADSPLGAIMVWIPASLAFLTLLFFGFFRKAGGSMPAAAAATFLVMFCNIAVSTAHVLVFDNGSPMAFMGYSEVIISVATFLIFCRWFQAELGATVAAPRARLVVPALLAATWCWYAPQNLVIALGACALTTAIWRYRFGDKGIARRLAAPTAVIAIACVVAALQFGSLMPASLREATGLWEQEPPRSAELRPYIQYMRNHWTRPRWNTEVEWETYDRLQVMSRKSGADDPYRALSWTYEENLWSSLRIYGFPMLGLALAGVLMRRRRAHGGEPHDAEAPWICLSAASFAIGYLIFFGLEIGHIKWWLSRFLVPGTAMGLSCLGLATLAGLASSARLGVRIASVALIALATVGPLVELASAASRNFGASGEHDSIGRRLSILVGRKGIYPAPPAR